MLLLFSIIVLQGLAKCEFLDALEESDVRVVKTRLEEEKAKRLLLQNDVDVLMTKVEMLERNLKRREPAEHSTTCTIQNPDISFSARLKSDSVLSSQQIVVFDQALHNVGTAYSPITGVFKAPVTGRYVFSVTLLTPSFIPDKKVHAQIMRNADEIGRLFTGDNKADWGHTGSLTVVTSLSVSDEVFVREMAGVTGHIHANYYCTFSGFLL